MRLRNSIAATLVGCTLATAAPISQATEYSDADFSGFFHFFFEYPLRAGRALASAGAYYVIIEPVTTLYGTDKEAYEEYVVKQREAVFETNDR